MRWLGSHLNSYRNQTLVAGYGLVPSIEATEHSRSTERRTAHIAGDTRISLGAYLTASSWITSVEYAAVSIQIILSRSLGPSILLAVCRLFLVAHSKQLKRVAHKAIRMMVIICVSTSAVTAFVGFAPDRPASNGSYATGMPSGEAITPLI